MADEISILISTVHGVTHQPMSTLPPNADISQCIGIVRYGP